jgi:hypothetical protein
MENQYPTSIHKNIFIDLLCYFLDEFKAGENTREISQEALLSPLKFQSTKF